MTLANGSQKNWGFATTNLAAGDFGLYQSNSNGGDPITAGTAKLYINSSGNVGIGEPSPNRKFHVNSGSTNVVAKFESTDAIAAIEFVDSGGSAEIGNSGNALVFFPAGTERMRIDSAGTATFTKSGGGNIRIAETASRYVEIFGYAEGTANGSTMAFHTIESGTSTSTERMRINSAGAISVGSSTQAVTELQLNHENSGGKGEIQLNSHGTASFSMLSNFTGGTVSGVATGGFGLITPHSYPISIVTNDLERMRIDSSGRVLVNTTANIGGARFNVEHPTDCIGCNLGPSASGTRYFMYFTYNGTNVGSITGTSTATAYNTSSDQRLKENIADADDAGSKVDAIQVRKYDWKADGSHQDYGMVAQELLDCCT